MSRTSKKRTPKRPLLSRMMDGFLGRPREDAMANTARPELGALDNSSSLDAQSPTSSALGDRKPEVQDHTIDSISEDISSSVGLDRDGYTSDIDR